MDIVDKLKELGVETNQDLLSVMLLRSLPENFENFRCTMSSRDELPSLETLQIKVEEGFDARKEGNTDQVQSAMYAGKHKGKFAKSLKMPELAKRDAKMKHYKCGDIGHRAKNCFKPRKDKDKSASASKSGGSQTALMCASSGKCPTGMSDVRRDWCMASTNHISHVR